MSIRALALWACCASAAAQPVAPRPSDFAWQQPLTVTGTNGVVQFRLPAHVYERARSAQLADLRVFDPAGQPVPFARHRPAQQTMSATRERDVRQFPVRDSGGDARDAVALSVRASDDGSLLAIEARSERLEAEAPLSALILDIGAAGGNETLERLQLVLPAGQSDYRATLLIEQSDDLQLWDALAQANVDWLSAADDARLVNDRIALSGATGRYLRVQWRAGAPRVFERIVARWRSATAVDDVPLQVTLDAQPGRQAGDWVYAASPAIAATRIGLELAQPNTVLPVDIGVYREQPRMQPAWRFEPQIAATFYRLLRDGEERRSSQIATAPIAHAQWVVRTQRPNEAAPRLVLQWHPDTIVFNVRGQGPYTLAFGAPPERMRDWTVDQTTLALVAPGYAANELAALEHAVAGAPSTTAAVETDTPLPRDAADAAIEQRTLLLWSVLALGVLVLAAMSWKLFKQMDADKGNG